jgi:hypothetical protein
MKELTQTIKEYEKWEILLYSLINL